MFWIYLQALNFSLDGKLSLSDLTMALENELLVTKNGIHQAALASFKAEIRYLLWVRVSAVTQLVQVEVTFSMLLIRLFLSRQRASRPRSPGERENPIGPGESRKTKKSARHWGGRASLCDWTHE